MEKTCSSCKHGEGITGSIKDNFVNKCLKRTYDCYSSCDDSCYKWEPVTADIKTTENS